MLATVKGDVHDIGKNLVDIILTNNGYKVFNIGIKQPVESMIAEFQKQDADAIGMSGSAGEVHRHHEGRLGDVKPAQA